MLDMADKRLYPTAMLKYRLNKIRIEEEMVKKNLNLTGLSRLLGFSLQLTHYALNHGGASFALKISRVFGIEPELIITPFVKGGPQRHDYQPSNLGKENVVATSKRVKAKPAPKKAAKTAKKATPKKK